MNLWRSVLLSFGIAALGACGGNKACLKAQPYQASVPGPQIKAPADLDDLRPIKETSIPEVSPGASTGNPSGDPCLEKPPFARRSRDIVEDSE